MLFLACSLNPRQAPCQETDCSPLQNERTSTLLLSRATRNTVLSRNSSRFRVFLIWQAVCISAYGMDPLTAAAANGLQASMDAFDMLANNLANSSTPGFKADREFYSTYLAPEANDEWNQSVGESPLIQKQWTDFAQGTLVNTGNATDLALSGAGFFAVTGPTGPLYTRSGSFHFSRQGTLVSAEGYPVRLTGSQTLQTQSASPLQVGADGQIMQDGNTLGQLDLANFKD